MATLAVAITHLRREGRNSSARQCRLDREQRERRERAGNRLVRRVEDAAGSFQMLQEAGPEPLPVAMAEKAHRANDPPITARPCSAREHPRAESRAFEHVQNAELVRFV